MKILNIWKHFFTITNHRILVCKHCFKIGLYRQGLLHDLSKYSPEEFWTGVKYYQGDRSPNAAEREEKGYSAAWLHHKGRNKHHFEYWTDVAPNKEKGLAGVPMPLNYAAEMICDRIAACQIYKGKNYTSASPMEYYQLTKDYIIIHPKTRAFLEKVLLILQDQGEEAAYAYLRKLLKERRQGRGIRRLRRLRRQGRSDFQGEFQAPRRLYGRRSARWGNRG